MAGKQSSETIAISPQMADDFTLIKGIGPVIAGRLYDAGIHTYDQMASLLPDELAAQVIGLSVTKITRQNWIGQAKKLTPKKARAKSLKKSSVIKTVRQHYENFTIEFLMDEKKIIRRTRVVHVQSGESASWVGLESKKLFEFLAQYLGRSILPVNRAYQESKNPKMALKIEEDNIPFETIRKPAKVLHLSPNTRLTMTGNATSEPAPRSPTVVNLSRSLHGDNMKLVSKESQSSRLFLRQGQPYSFRLILDFWEVMIPSDILLEYKATTIIKQVGGQDHIACKTKGNFELPGGIPLDLIEVSLHPGLYRLNTTVRIVSDEPVSDFTANIKGDLIQVY